MMMNGEAFGTYLFTYEHAGASWVLEIKAADVDDAKARMRKLYAATYGGEMVAKLTTPQIGLTRLASRIWRWLTSK
jgi:hypothetical protein